MTPDIFRDDAVMKRKWGGHSVGKGSLLCGNDVE